MGTCGIASPERLHFLDTYLWLHDRRELTPGLAQPPVKAESEAGEPGCEDKVEGPVLGAHVGHPQLGAQTALVILQRITGESHQPPMQEIDTAQAVTWDTSLN